MVRYTFLCTFAHDFETNTRRRTKKSTMINRELIRLKVVQLVYAYNQNSDQSVDAGEKELLFSLSKSYDLYMYLLQLMVEVHRMAKRQLEMAEQRSQRLGEPFCPNLRFVSNRFVLQLRNNEQLQAFRECQKKTWADDEDFVRQFFRRITQSNVYQAWMEQTEPTTYEEEREFWRALYRDVFAKDEDLDELLEEKSIYWNDDRFIVDTFVLKTIHRFEEAQGAEQPLLPEFKDVEDREYARQLFRASVLGAETYRTLLTSVLQHWELERMATMDVLLVQTALAEMFTFPNIPAAVTINEYVEIAKMYSTPKSGSYINGLLDALAKKCREEGTLQK